MTDSKDLQQRRRTRLRFQLRRKAGGRPRLSVFRSGKHIYAQVIDDAQGKTLASASTLEKDVREVYRFYHVPSSNTALGHLILENKR